MTTLPDFVDKIQEAINAISIKQLLGDSPEIIARTAQHWLNKWCLKDKLKQSATAARDII